MIKVTVLEDSDRVVRELKLTGHAGYGEEGQDIVCAAVSALVFSAYNSIETFTEDDFEGSADERSGDFQLRFSGEISPESKLLMNSLVLGLANIMESYGKQYIKIRFEEV